MCIDVFFHSVEMVELVDLQADNFLLSVYLTGFVTVEQKGRMRTLKYAEQ